ncbi:MAG TPA: aldose 1-epimerase family protein [Jatrophihabitantaceae bacterium]|nr:aldose 1-epimerase family protein [Jatrophihabitantaceae bacterium]
MALTGQQFTITAGEHEATVVEVGAGLRRYTHRGADVTCTYADEVLPPKCCGAVLVPWPNRLRGGQYTFDGTAQQLAITEPSTGNAIHGLGRWERWSVRQQDASSVTLGLDIVPQTGWPFELAVEVRYALDVDAGLRVDASAHNHGRVRTPFGAGFHPYLACGPDGLDGVTVTIPADTRLLVDEVQIPTGSEPVEGTGYDLRAGRRLGDLRMDDCFTGLTFAAGRAVAEVRTAAGGAQVWCDESFGHLQAFTLDAFPGGGSGIALEPMTCAPDAFNSGAGLITLEPGASWAGSWGVTPL